MEQYKLEADRLIMIGDSEGDFIAAKGANVDFIGVNSGVFGKNDWEERGVINVESIKDLI